MFSESKQPQGRVACLHFVAMCLQLLWSWTALEDLVKGFDVVIVGLGVLGYDFQLAADVDAACRCQSHWASSKGIGLGIHRRPRCNLTEVIAGRPLLQTCRVCGQKLGRLLVFVSSMTQAPNKGFGNLIQEALNTQGAKTLCPV